MIDRLTYWPAVHTIYVQISTQTVSITTEPQSTNELPSETQQRHSEKSILEHLFFVFFISPITFWTVWTKLNFQFTLRVLPISSSFQFFHKFKGEHRWLNFDRGNELLTQFPLIDTRCSKYHEKDRRTTPVWKCEIRLLFTHHTTSSSYDNKILLETDIPSAPLVNGHCVIPCVLHEWKNSSFLLLMY